MNSHLRTLAIVLAVAAWSGPIAVADESDNPQDFLEALRQGQAYRDNFAFSWDYQKRLRLLPENSKEVLIVGQARFVYSDGRFRKTNERSGSDPEGRFVHLFGSGDWRFDGARLDWFSHGGKTNGQGQPSDTFYTAGPDEEIFNHVQDFWAVSSTFDNVDAIEMIPLFGALPGTNEFWMDEFLAKRDTNAEPLDTPCETCPPSAIGWRFYDDDVNIRIWLDPDKGNQITGFESLVLRNAFFAPETTFEGDYYSTKLFNVEIANVAGHWVPVRGSYSHEVPRGYYGVEQESWDQIEKSHSVVRFDVDVQARDFDFESTYNDNFFVHEFPAGAVVHDASARIQLVAQADGRTLKRKSDPPEKVLAQIQREAMEIKRLVRD